MSSGAVLTRSDACRGPTNPSGFMPLAGPVDDELRGAAPSGAASGRRRPWKKPLGARGSITQVCEVRDVGFVDLLPGADGRGQNPVQQRRVDVLAPARSVPGP